MTLLVVLMMASAPLVAGVAGASSASPASSASSSTADAARSNVDVVFVFDSSASTNEDRYHMAQEIDTLANRFESADIDARYGLVTYNGSVRTELPLTSEFDSFEKAMHFPVSGNEEHASDGILTATNMTFRQDATTVVVVVTDEDDDSSNATRDDAVSALSGSHFIAVSPSSPAESSCAVHSPPCDNRSDNELRTLADHTGDDWIDQSQSAETTVEDIADAIEAQVDSGSGSGSDSGSDSGSGSGSGSGSETRSTPRAEFTTTNRSTNRTTAEVGDRIRFTKTVENVGGADGTYEAYLSHEGTILAERTLSVPAGESRTITFLHRFDRPGEYEILITHESIATVNVTAPATASVEVAPRTNGTGVNATISDARTDGTVSIPVTDAGIAPDEVATIQNVVVSVGDANVTPVHDVAFDLEVVATETTPNGTDSLPEHVTRVRYLTVGSSLGADLAGVQFEYVASANGTTMYRYDFANSTWIPLDRSAVNETDALVRTDSSNATLYAIGVRQPSISVTAVDLDDASIVADETTGTTVTVSNEGTAATATSTGESTAESTTSTGAVPGFDLGTAIGTLVALASLALLARRRT